MDNEINDRSINPLIRIADSLEEIIKMIKQEQEEVKNTERKTMSKYTLTQILLAWTEVYGEDMEEEYPGFIQKLQEEEKNEKNKT